MSISPKSFTEPAPSIALDDADKVRLSAPGLVVIDIPLPATKVKISSAWSALKSVCPAT